MEINFECWRKGKVFLNSNKISICCNWTCKIFENRSTNYIFMAKMSPDSLVVRASVSGSEGRGFAPRPRHTKGVKNGTGSSLADARNERVHL